MHLYDINIVRDIKHINLYLHAYSINCGVLSILNLLAVETPVVALLTSATFIFCLSLAPTVSHFAIVRKHCTQSVL